MTENIVNHLKDMTTCSICTDTLKNQRALPCIHTFCCDCLRQYVSQMKKQPGDKVPCPLCRAEFTLPAGNVTDLRKNFFIENLLELLRTAQNTQSHMECDICKANAEKDDEILPATMYCIECRENMCKKCFSEHKRQTFSRAHHVTLLGSKISEDMFRKFSPHFCDLHSDKQLEMYCFDCKIVLCVMCFVEKHKQHQCADSKKAAQKFKQELRNIKLNIDNYEIKASDIKKEIETKKIGCLKSVKETKGKIIAAGNQLKSTVDERVSSLLKELKSVEKNLLKEFATEHEQLDGHVAALQPLKTFSSALVARGSSHDICQSANDLKTRASELEENHRSFLNEGLMKPEVNFMVSNVDPDNFVGKIQIIKTETPSGNQPGPSRSGRKRASVLKLDGSKPVKTSAYHFRQTNDMIDLCILTFTGPEWITINRRSSANDLFERLSLMMKIPKDDLRVRYNGRPIEPGNECLMDYGICHEEALDIYLRQSGS